VTGTLMFVHGTGTWAGRRDGAAPAVDAIVRQLEQGVARGRLEGMRVVAPPWAAHCGAAWPDLSVCLPVPTPTRGVPGAPDGTDDESGLWDLLSRDPLLELRFAALTAAGQPTSMLPGVLPADAAVAALLEAARPEPDDLVALDVSPSQFAVAASAVAGSAELAGAARAVGSASDPPLLDMVARAVVGELLRHGLAPGAPDLDGALPVFAADALATHTLYEVVRAGIGQGSYRGIVSTPLRTALLGLAAQVGTAWAVPRRGRLMDPVTTFAADILFYLAHADQVRAYLCAEMEHYEPPVVAVGHSLGGVAMVDLLSVTERPAVDLLVTVGSQAPYLYLVGALAHLRPGTPSSAPSSAPPSQASAKPFAPWLNVYNRKDLLSFCAERAFPGVPGVRDVEVDPGVPFPQSHSAYWWSEQFWKAMDDAWSPRAVTPW
jgi:hypothetical protein